MNESDTFIIAQGSIVDEIESVLRAMKLTDQLGQAKMTCNSYEKKYKKEASRMTTIAAEHNLMQKRRRTR